MFRPSIQKTHILFIIAIINIIVYIIVSSSIVTNQSLDYNIKIESSQKMKNALSIKRTTYNANPWTGEVNWKKNVTGVDSTKDMYPTPQGTRGK